MKEIKVSVNTWYVVEGTAGATVTNPSTNRVIATVEDGKQASFYATTPYVLASDDSVSVYKVPFNCAPALGSGGGATITFDEAPTEGSLNAVTSGGVYKALLFDRGGWSMSIGTRVSVGSFGLAIGYEAVGGKHNAVSLGMRAKTDYQGVAIGCEAEATGAQSLAIGKGSKSTGAWSAAIGHSVKAKDQGINVAGVFDSASNIQTLFYIIGANTSLANTYENGAACLGYVVKDTSGNVLACGTRKLSELLTNNTAFAPAMLDLDSPPPTPFLPTGAMEPIEFPEPEVYPETNF